ncbi:MAG TPA: tripartite tricarboxylate transporter TctB family protein [Afifellaceae bacterium]|nr:tripartite tricarboxylate transporter TctB family protein [Afifellaceae bacterium]
MSDKPFIEAEGAVPAAPSRSVAEEAARLVSYLLLIALCGWLYVVAGDLPASRWEPLGAGAFPRLVVATLAFFCAVATIHSVRKLARSSQWAEPGAGARVWLARHRLVLALLVGFGVYLAVIAQLGFTLSSFLFLLFAQILLAPRTWQAWAVALAIAIVFSWGVNLLFAEVFQIFLPRGQLFR